MKNILFYLILFFGLSGILHPVWAQQPVKNLKLLDSIVAVVNNDIILASELDKRTFEAANDLAARNIAVKDLQQLHLRVLDNLILERLQLERVKQLGIDVTDEEVFIQLQKIADENNLSMVQLRERLNLQQPQGFQKTRDNIRKQMLFQKLQEIEIIAKTQVTEGEIDNFLQRDRLQNHNIEYHLQHIMISLPENSTPQQKQQIQQKSQNILKRIQQGADFSEMALKYSTGNQALQGGDLGWLGIDSIPTLFIDSVTELEDGQVSSIIPSPIGFHIVKLLNQRDANIQMTTQYKLHRFIFLSDKAINAPTPPLALAGLSKSIRNLEDFNKLNDQFSDMPSAINAGSQLGWKALKQLPVSYAKALKTITDLGHASLPFATAQGWVILYLDNIRQTDLNQTDRRLQAMQTLRIQKANETFEIWLRRLREGAMIDNRLLNPLKTNPLL